MTNEDDFNRALDAEPRDMQTRLVFADWLQDRGDPRAAGYRALAALGLYPVDLRIHDPTTNPQASFPGGTKDWDANKAMPSGYFVVENVLPMYPGYPFLWLKVIAGGRFAHAAIPPKWYDTITVHYPKAKRKGAASGAVDVSLAAPNEPRGVITAIPALPFATRRAAEDAAVRSFIHMPAHYQNSLLLGQGAYTPPLSPASQSPEAAGLDMEWLDRCEREEVDEPGAPEDIRGSDEEDNKASED